VEAGVRWAERDPRVRALLLKGSLARGEADARSDVDFLVVAQPGQLDDLWVARREIAEGLGGWLGGFDEVAWQAPHTHIGFCDGPVKVDFFQEGEPAAEPWLRDGFRALFDPDGLADRLRAALGAEPAAPDLSDFDVHAWGLAVGRPFEAASALRRALKAALDSYLALRPRLAAERGMPARRGPGRTGATGVERRSVLRPGLARTTSPAAQQARKPREARPSGHAPRLLLPARALLTATPALLLVSRGIWVAAYASASPRWWGPSGRSVAKAPQARSLLHETRASS
jgi:hypothetical protein